MVDAAPGDRVREQALGLIEGGADYLLLETCQDTRNVKAGLLGIDEAFQALGCRIPVAVSGTIENTGTMLAGQDVEALAVSLMHRDLLYLGLNCATGPELMAEPLRTLSELAHTRVACVPNAGLPDEDGLYNEGPEVFAEVFGRFLDEGWLNLVGGCCGTTEAHVAALADLVEGARPRHPAVHQRALVSGIDAVELTPDNRPLLVGERTNVLGSRKFKQLIAAGEWEAAAEVGVDGVIVPDLPPEEGEQLFSALEGRGIDGVLLAAPTTSPERLKLLAERTRGFLYYVSLTGVTTARTELAQGIQERVEQIRGLTELPVCVGFGVSTPAHASEIGQFADGVVVGSAIVDRIESARDPAEAVDRVASFVKELKAPLRG